MSSVMPLRLSMSSVMPLRLLRLTVRRPRLLRLIARSPSRASTSEAGVTIRRATIRKCAIARAAGTGFLTTRSVNVKEPLMQPDLRPAA